MPSSILSALPLDELIGSTLAAIVKSQSMASAETAALIERVGFQTSPDGTSRQARTFDFRFPRREFDEATGTFMDREVALSVPLLTLINLPTLVVDEASLDPEVQITGRVTSETSAAPVGPAAPAVQPTRFLAMPARRVGSQQSADLSSTVKVNLKVRAHDQPLGIERLLGLLNSGGGERVTNQVTGNPGRTGLGITVGGLPDGAVGSEYAARLTARQGVPPYRWSLASGALPPGLALDESGGLTGTPTVPGSYAFTVQVADAGQPADLATAALQIRVV